ncbi:peroxiredoxin [Arsenicitalea aurantiaca]|uniref:thioredoxin-dependent peroxiredoxin n=1 Tax=Arsenicitalea aurantiaca TaxID=1783274 RepID=A0A433XG39_9HYPH|nr:peroxiredoxin [Arsenicitalea aurantiaca]RUT32918.1 peroxiredoxin [Arsenicitalea aurantiaca]
MPAIDLTIGATAPDFTLLDQHGEAFSLSAHRGRAVVLYFYPQDDTDGCTRENLEFSELSTAFAEAGVTLAGVSPDDVDCHARFAEKYRLPMRLLADPERTTIEAYGLWRQKSLYGREYMGLVRTTVLVDADGRIAGLWSVSRIKGHAAKVLDAAKALGA